MASFKIKKITNGYLVKIDTGLLQNSDNEFFEDKVLFAFTLEDAFQMIADEADRLAHDAQDPLDQGESTEEQDELPF